MTSLAEAGVLVALAYTLWKLLPVIIRPYYTGIRNLPGPPSAHWFYGNYKEVFDAGKIDLQQQWVKEYGSNIMFKGPFGERTLTTFDTRALNHILMQPAVYQRPEKDRRTLARVLGEGLLSTEGTQHTKQRRIMNPAFGPAQIRELTEIFVQKAVELRDAWSAEITDEGHARINVLAGLGKMTLDVIGLAGFSYSFDAISGKDTELSRAMQELFGKPPPVTPMTIVRGAIPLVAKLFPGDYLRRVDEAQRVMRRVGSQLIAEKRAAILRQMADKRLGMERKDVVGRDLLTLLLKANMATDIPDSQRLSDDDVLAQVPTFIAAGHETTSGASMWGLYALTQAPEAQRKLREELFTVETDNPTMDELAALPYLDAVVRETLRVYAPVSLSTRVAAEDDVIPVSTPFTDRFGKEQYEIKISKGTEIVVPILAMNLSKELWGEDANEFKPERWEDMPKASASVPGVWAHLMTFLSGPRACIGYRFSLVEMKAILFTLVRAFEFELAVPREDVVKLSAVMLRPAVRSEPEMGSQMPLLVRPYKRA